MDVQAYINSGVLELYVLDLLDAPGRREVEAYARQYPEIAAEINGIELGLEAYCVAEGVVPNPDVLDQVLQSLKEQESAPSSQQASAGSPLPPQSSVAPASSPKGMGWLAWLFALILGAGLLYYYLQYRQATAEREELTNELTTLEAECNTTASTLEATRERLRLLAAPGTQSILLAGTDNAPESAALVYHNPAEEITYFRASALPAPPAGRQYQLWAINADGPQSLGVLELDLESDTIKAVDFVEGVATFAITLEPEGGLPNPTLSALQVAGNTAG